ncbi:MAG TPA: signal recognition particle-docking protein FtsY [Ktedonobacterales bacterium]|nr:signal recognition particle-docking protein FtsY [Ktedonobacterales bacterium]
MFKRLRDNLFKRQDAEQEELEELEEQEEQEGAEAEAPDVVEGSLADAPDAATLARDGAPVVTPAPDATSAQPPAGPPAAPMAPVPTTSASAAPAPALPAQSSDDDNAPVDALEGNEDDAALDEEQVSQRRGLFNPFKLTLGRTRQLFGHVNEALANDDITDDLWDELEETLISSDVGVQTTERVMSALRERAAAEQMTRGSQLRAALKEELEVLLGDPEPLVFSESSPITVLLFVGVNGVGKTTSIAKLAHLMKRQKHRVMLAAGDTFRAAAVEQLKTWGERVGVPVIAHQQGVDPKSVADPAAVVFDAMQAAQARGTDVLIVDTAGRLHTKINLMDELKKIVRVLQKYDPEAPHEVLLVLDATTGQNGLAQAKQFVQDSGVSGVVLTKLDGTARGGIVFAIASELGLPIKYIGTGEKVGDIAPFDADQFIDALFAEE